MSNTANDNPIVCLTDLTPATVEWLWPGRLPLGKLVLLDGDPQEGKSLLTLDWAARLTTAPLSPARPGLACLRRPPKPDPPPATALSPASPAPSSFPPPPAPRSGPPAPPPPPPPPPPPASRPTSTPCLRPFPSAFAATTT